MTIATQTMLAENDWIDLIWLVVVAIFWLGGIAASNHEAEVDEKPKPKPRKRATRKTAKTAGAT